MSKVSYNVYDDEVGYDDATESAPLLAKTVNANYLPTPLGSKIAVVCILFCELCERLTYYSIVANLLMYLTDTLEFATNDGLTITFVFTGTVYFTPIIGGWIADALMGRYSTILVSALIYTVGCVLLPIVAFDNFGDNKPLSRGIYITSLVLIAIGTGGIKANVSTFGAQQVADMGEKYIQRFFTWFYWFINIGSAIAYAFVSYLQQEVSFFYGYLVPGLTIVLSIILLIVPCKMLIHEKSVGRSAVVDVVKVVYDAIRSKSQSIYSLPSTLDYALFVNGGNYSHKTVNDVKTVILIIPVMLTLVLFWCIYNQMQTTFFLQGERMDLTIGGLTLPVAMLNLFNALAIVIFTPILDMIIFPCIRRITKTTSVSLLGRIGFGMILASGAVVIGGILEIYRKEDIATNGGFRQELSNNVYNASNLTILYQAPQFLCIGLAEIFTSATSLELIYTDTPEEFKSFAMGVLMSMSGLGSYVGSALVGAVNAATYPDSWIPDDINNGHFEYFCFLLSALGIVFFILYIPIAIWYRRAHDIVVSERRPTGGGQITPRKYDDQLTDNRQSSCDSVTLVTTGEFRRSKL